MTLVCHSDIPMSLLRDWSVLLRRSSRPECRVSSSRVLWIAGVIAAESHDDWVFIREPLMVNIPVGNSVVHARADWTLDESEVPGKDINKGEHTVPSDRVYTELRDTLPPIGGKPGVGVSS